MNERQAVLKRLGEIRAEVYRLNLEAREIQRQYGPFTQAERQAESARIDRDFSANLFYYTLGDGCMWNLAERAVMFQSRESAQKFKAAYPDFNSRWEPTR
jgi:hypothetical protein